MWGHTMELVDNQEFANSIDQGVQSTCPIDSENESGPQNHGLLAQLTEALPKPETQDPALSEGIAAISLTNDDNGPMLG